MKVLTIQSQKFLDNLRNKHFKKFIEGSNIILISADLRTNEMSEHVIKMGQLVPPPQAIQVFQSNDIVKFNELYFKYLQTPAMSVILATLLHEAANENRDVIFMCSKSEDQYGYLELLGNFCQAVYEIVPVKLKDIVKDKPLKKYDTSNASVSDVAEERISRAVEAVPNVVSVVKELFDPEKDKKKKSKKKKKK